MNSEYPKFLWPSHHQTPSTCPHVRPAFLYSYNVQPQLRLPSVSRAHTPHTPTPKSEPFPESQPNSESCISSSKACRSKTDSGWASGSRGNGSTVCSASTAVLVSRKSRSSCSSPKGVRARNKSSLGIIGIKVLVGPTGGKVRGR